MILESKTEWGMGFEYTDSYFYWYLYGGYADDWLFCVQANV